MTTFEWEAPGPGWWFFTRDHFPAPVSRLFAAIFPATTLGWLTSAERYGLPDGPSAWGWVNGWVYYQPGAGADPSTYDALEAAAIETLATSRWRADVTRWHEIERPRIVAANLALQHEDLTDLSDHLRRLIDHYVAVGVVHFELHTAFNVAGGLLFEACADLGLDQRDLAPLFAGSSPASARAREHIDGIAAGLDRDPASIDDLRGPALDAYLDEYGWRCLDQHELQGSTLGERPDLVVASVRARRAGIGGTGVQPPPIPAGIPEALLADARATYMLNDDSVGITFGWPLGLIRRAALELGRRAALHDIDDVFQCDPDELVALADGDGPSADELASRAARIDEARSADPPAALGGPSEETASVPPPPTVARLAAARAAMWASVPKASEAPLTGFGIGTSAYRGRACVIDDINAMFDLEPGDVLIATITHAGHSTVFPIAGAVATEEGGLLSHPAVLARELGLPAVIGVRGLLERVKTGDTVEVDPVAGVVRVFGGSGPDG